MKSECCTQQQLERELAQTTGERRAYAWALLDKTGIVPPAELATVIASPTAPECVATKPRAIFPATNSVPI